MSSDAIANQPRSTTFTCREGEGVHLGGDRVMVQEIGAGIIVLRATSPMPTRHRCRLGDKLTIAGADVLVEKLTEDGKRRVVLRVTASPMLAVSKISRPAMPGGNRRDHRLALVNIGVMAWPLS